jgi:hypothetical protein
LSIIVMLCFVFSCSGAPTIGALRRGIGRVYGNLSRILFGGTIVTVGLS